MFTGCRVVEGDPDIWVTRFTTQKRRGKEVAYVNVLGFCEVLFTKALVPLKETINYLLNVLSYKK